MPVVLHLEADSGEDDAVLVVWFFFCFDYLKMYVQTEHKQYIHPRSRSSLILSIVSLSVEFLSERWSMSQNCFSF